MRNGNAKTNGNGEDPVAKPIRCAIYTRKSTDEGLQQEFNSLDAQREAGEAYILSQRHEGWQLVPTHYDDGGYTGGNMDRPALKKPADYFETAPTGVAVAPLVLEWVCFHGSLSAAPRRLNDLTRAGSLPSRRLAERTRSIRRRGPRRPSGIPPWPVRRARYLAEKGEPAPTADQAPEHFSSKR
ncbi:MAG: recombinase family protein [Acidobacteriia bacterium]|nr:recombinase family protein [Terriglobia bacterium]